MRNQKTIITLVAIGFALIIFFQFRQYADLAVIKQQRHLIHSFIGNQFWLASFAFLALYIITCACALPFGGILTFSGGYFFGLATTVLIACIGATAGAVIAFLLARYVLQDTIEQRYPTQLQWLNNELDKHGAHYLLFIRLMPFMPYFIINPVAGLTRISLFTFIWTMAIGVIPGSAVLAFAGKEFAHINSLRGIISWHVAAPLCLLALMALLPMVMQKRRQRKSSISDQIAGCSD